VLVCKLVDGKITYVHRRLWPALVRLAARFRKEQLIKSGTSNADRRASVPQDDLPGLGASEILREAERLSLDDAERILSPWLAFGVKQAGR